jgi:CheY-like chemotaxis protein
VSSLAHLWLEIDRGTRVAPQLKAGPELVAHTYEVIATARGLERAMQDAERGQRSYLITADAAHLDVYRSGTADVPLRLARLKQLTLGNAEQQRRWPVLEHQVEIKLAELRRTLDPLFTDIGLPGGVNGRQLADEALRLVPALKVLFTTGYTRNAVIHHGRLDPGVQLIAKPFTQSGLAQKVWQVLYGAA